MLRNFTGLSRTAVFAVELCGSALILCCEVMGAKDSLQNVIIFGTLQIPLHYK